MRSEASAVSEVSPSPSEGRRGSSPQLDEGHAPVCGRRAPMSASHPSEAEGATRSVLASGDRAILWPDFLRVNTNVFQSSESNPA